jgi:hypothetical protein
MGTSKNTPEKKKKAMAQPVASSVRGLRLARYPCEHFPSRQCEPSLRLSREGQAKKLAWHGAVIDWGQG